MTELLEASAPVVPAFALNEDQLQAIQLMKHHFDPNKEESSVPFFLLIGPAGTGKTTCTKQLALECPDLRIAFTAPTNKAVKVLRESLKGVPNVQTATIYSLLGLRMESNGLIKQLAIPDDLELKDVDAVVVDEGSMVNQELHTYIREAQSTSGIPFIFMGDRAQLPPVKELLSPIWQIENHFELTKVVRHDNQILTLATYLRGKVDLPFPQIHIKSDHAEEEGVWKMATAPFEGGLLKYAAEGRFHEGTCKAIAWRNVTVSRLNALIRDACMGYTPLPFAKGDRVIAKSPCYDGKELLLHTDDEGLCEEVLEGTNRWFSEYRSIRMRIRPDGRSGSTWVWAVHPQSAAALTADLKALAAKAVANRSLWKDYWKLRESFHDISLAYAITAHRSQGSTYQSTFVDMTDILYNPNKQEAMRCLYVACTRAKKQLFLHG